MDKKICNKCSTENDGNFVFCKHCGAMLPVVDKRYNYPFEEEENRQQAEEPEIDGIPLREMNIYINKRPHKFIPKFIRMEATGQKISSCIPVLLFGLFFGFFGIAIWFFWRKMPKIGSLFVALGFALSFADVIVNHGVYSDLTNGFFGLMQDVAKNPVAYHNSAAVNEAMNPLIEAFYAGYNPVISLITRYVANLAAPAAVSLYALYLYKNKAVSDIKRIKANPLPSIPVEVQIARKGGGSGAMVLIPVFAYVLSSFIPFALCLI